MSEWSRRQRLEATIRGEQPDRIPVALWRHFPGDDQDPAQLAASTLAFQQEYDWDLVKVTPASSYCVADWGAQDRWVGNEEGTREYTYYPIQEPGDWYSLEALEPAEGRLGDQLRCLEILQAALGVEVPFIQTIFSPLAQAKNLAGGRRLLVHLRQDPAAVRAGLEAIVRTTVEFIEEARQRGIAGIFLAVQHASYGLMSWREYEEWGVPLDRRVLEAAEGLWLNLLHLHGPDVMFGLLAGYPVHGINWHDRETPPTLAAGMAQVRGAVVGGLRQWETILRGSPDAVRAEALDAVRQTGGRRLILGTGCVTPITAPWSNLRALRDVAPN